VELDVRTIYVMYAVLYLMLHGIIWFSLSRYQSRLVTQWSAAGMVSATGLALLGSQGVLPEWLVACLGQILMAVGNFARQHVLRSTDGPAGHRWIAWNGALHLIYLSLNGWLFFSGASHRSMMLVFFLFYALICVDFFFSGRAMGQRRQTSGAMAIQLGGLVFSISLGIKAVTLLAGWGAQGLYDPGWDQAALFACQILAISLLNFGFVQMLMDQFQQERAQVEQALVQQRQQATAAQLKSIDLASLLREREEIIRQLTLSNKTAGMGALVASIAHELNQPLTSILLKAELVESHLSRPAQPSSLIPSNAQLLDMVRQDTLHAGAIIRRLRSMFANGKAEFSPLDLAVLVNDVVQIVRSQAQRLDISLHIDVSGPLPIHGDVTQLQQVILNLLNNAMESFEGVQGRAFFISITGARRGDWVELRIADNGCGIAKELQSDVFALFKTSKDKGMGVGLWLSRSVVEGHAGRLELASEPGSGAVFSLALPAHS
jgi:signal transduction histidine kinase